MGFRMSALRRFGTVQSDESLQVPCCGEVEKPSVRTAGCGGQRCVHALGPACWMWAVHQHEELKSPLSSEGLQLFSGFWVDVSAFLAQDWHKQMDTDNYAV